MKLIKLINTLETFYPIDLAEDWDNVGLLLG
ncbi:MAG: Nif3-like dinuclear metal center hexameric protein, partial [Mycoplasmatales bacterium]